MVEEVEKALQIIVRTAGERGMIRRELLQKINNQPDFNPLLPQEMAQPVLQLLRRMRLHRYNRVFVKFADGEIGVYSSPFIRQWNFIWGIRRNNFQHLLRSAPLANVRKNDSLHGIIADNQIALQEVELLHEIGHRGQIAVSVVVVQVLHVEVE